MLWIWKTFPNPVCINQRMPIDGAKSIDCIAVHLLHLFVACSPPQKNKSTETRGRIGETLSRGLISRLVACKIACLHKKQCRDATYSQVIIILCSESIIAI
jgi:hypothetical protein